MPSETIKLTARLKLKEVLEGLDYLFSTYREIVNYLITYAYKNNITSFCRLKKETYKILREKYPQLPRHYLYTACQMATSIYKSYRKRRRRGRAKGKPVFKKDVIMLDDYLFRLYLERGIVRLSMPDGRVTLEFYPAKYHEKFKDWKIGQAWLVKAPKGVFINVVFSREVKERVAENIMTIDVNEKNVTVSLPNGEFIQIITHEREIRTGYYVKRRRIQRKLRAGKRRKILLKKYGERERNRIRDLYHKLTNKIIEIAERYGGIALENLRGFREHVRYSRDVNGRLHRWAFRRLQEIIEYKAKLKGIRVIYVDPAQTSSLCLICGGRG